MRLEPRFPDSQTSPFTLLFLLLYLLSSLSFPTGLMPWSSEHGMLFHVQLVRTGKWLGPLSLFYRQTWRKGQAWYRGEKGTCVNMRLCIHAHQLLRMVEMPGTRNYYQKKTYVICLNSIRMSCYIEMHEDSSKGGSLLSTSFNSSTANVSHRLNGQSQTKNVIKKDYLCVTIPPTPYSHSQTER